MSLRRFEFFEKPDVRLVVLQDTVFKIKMSCKHESDSKNINLLCKGNKAQKDLEKAICAALGTDKLEPIVTEFFVIHPFTVDTSRKRKIRHDQNTVTCGLEEREYANTSNMEYEGDMKRRRLVCEYDQKNRHDIENQNLHEQLRLQELARPSYGCVGDGLETNQDIDRPNAKGMFSFLRKWFGGE